MNRSTIAANTALSLLLCILCAFQAYSEECFPVSSVERGNDRVALKYVEQTESSCLVYAVFTVPDEVSEPVLINVSRSSYVTDGKDDFKFVRAYNVPVYDESIPEFSILEDGDRKLNFILEFEKFPLDGRFDIIDDPSNDEALNIYGVCVDTATGKEVDRNRFTGSTRPARCGEYFEEGNNNMYYIRDGVFVSCHSSCSDEYFTLYLSIVNESDHGILFKNDNIAVKGNRVKNKNATEVDLPLLSKNEYVRLVESDDFQEAEKSSHSEGLEEIGLAVSFAALGTQFRSMERVGLKFLGGLIQDINHINARPYLAELDKTRAERTKNYLQSQSIRPGDSHTGFIKVKRPKKVNDFLMTLHMDGYDFQFYSKIDEQ